MKFPETKPISQYTGELSNAMDEKQGSFTRDKTLGFKLSWTRKEDAIKLLEQQKAFRELGVQIL